MLQTLERIDHVYDRLPLPLDRNEFEDRALLYAVIQDMRSLLQIKRDFFLSSNKRRWASGEVAVSCQIRV